MQKKSIRHLWLKQTDLANLKSDVDKLYIDKLKHIPYNLSNLRSKANKLDFGKLVPVPVDLSKLNDVAKYDFVKKDVYNAKIRNTEDKIPDVANWATNASLNAKINEVKSEVPSISNLGTTAALTTVENKIPNISNLVKKTDYNTIINEIEKKITDHDDDHDHDEYLTTPECNKLTPENFAARLKQANLASKSDIANFVNKTDFDNKLLSFNKKIDLNKTKDVIVDNELNQLSKEFKAISTKGLTKDLITGYKIRGKIILLRNNTKSFIYFSYKKYFKFFSNTHLKFYNENL